MLQLVVLHHSVNCADGDTMHRPHPVAAGLVHYGKLRQTTDEAAAPFLQHTLQITDYTDYTTEINYQVLRY